MGTTPNTPPVGPNMSSGATTYTQVDTCPGSGNLFGLCSGLNPIIPSHIGLTDILSERHGFGHDITGGSDGLVYLVTTLDESGPGSLREAAALTQPVWIVFNMPGTIVLSSPINITSNKTIDGRFSSIEITGRGIRIATPCSTPKDGCYIDPGPDNVTQNVIVTNIKIRDIVNDGIQIATAHKVWIHRNTIAGDGVDNPYKGSGVTDGLLDVTGSHKYIVGGARVLISWNRFIAESKAMLLGIQKDTYVQPWMDDRNLRVTLHHNYFNGTEQRNPRVARAVVHSYNNVLNNWKVYGGCAAEGGQLFTENGFFVASWLSHGPGIDNVCGELTSGHTYTIGSRVYGDVEFSSNASYPVDGFYPQTEPNYTYNMWDSTGANMATIQERAGRQDYNYR